MEDIQSKIRALEWKVEETKVKHFSSGFQFILTDEKLTVQITQEIQSKQDELTKARSDLITAQVLLPFNEFICSRSLSQKLKCYE